MRSGMIKMGLWFGCLFVAACGGETGGAKPDGSATTAASSAPAASASGAASAAPSASAAAKPDDPCGDDVWEPKKADVEFAWTDAPTLASAPTEGVFAHVDGITFEMDEVAVRVNEKRGEWTLEAKSKPLGPTLIFKGAAPAPNAEVKEDMGNNRGFFQVPQKDVEKICHRTSTSYNGENARVVKFTKFDKEAKLADGVFVTTWKTRDDKQYWAAGTFKDAKLTIF